jgi:radical SAM protein with 4Fe4S-binding SPASM domain
MSWIYKLERLAVNNYRNRFYKSTLKDKQVLPPTFILWDCTRRCNLNCEHCGASKEKYFEELSKKEILTVIDDLAKVKTRMFTVTGGEPFMRRDLLEILEYANKKRIKTGIASNGYLIDRELAKKIKQAKVYSMQISIDGLEKTHNKIRKNSKSFTNAVNAIQNLQNINLPVLQVATTITKSNFNELTQIFELLKKLKVKMWRLGIIMPIGRAVDKNLLLNKKELNELLNFVKHNNHKGISIHIAENLPFLNNYEEELRQEPVLCPVGITTCCIGVTGTVRGCPEQPDTPEYHEGNVKKTSIIDIWQKGFKKYRLKTILSEDKRCLTCKNKNKCLGGCWVMRENNTQCIHDLI